MRWYDAIAFEDYTADVSGGNVLGGKIGVVTTLPSLLPQLLDINANNLTALNSTGVTIVGGLTPIAHNGNFVFPFQGHVRIYNGNAPYGTTQTLSIANPKVLAASSTNLFVATNGSGAGSPNILVYDNNYALATTIVAPGNVVWMCVTDAHLSVLCSGLANIYRWSLADFTSAANLALSFSVTSGFIAYATEGRYCIGSGSLSSTYLLSSANASPIATKTFTSDRRIAYANGAFALTSANTASKCMIIRASDGVTLATPALNNGGGAVEGSDYLYVSDSSGLVDVVSPINGTIQTSLTANTYFL